MGEITIGDKVILISPNDPSIIYYVGNKFEVLLVEGMEGFPNNMDCEYMLISEDGATLGVNRDNIVKVENDDEIVSYCSKVINMYSTYLNNFSTLLSQTLEKKTDTE